MCTITVHYNPFSSWPHRHQFFSNHSTRSSTQTHKRKVHAFEVKTQIWGKYGDGGVRISPGQGFDWSKETKFPSPFLNYPSTICTQTDRDPDKGIKLVFLNFDVVHLLVILFHGHFANPFWNGFFSFVLRIYVKLLVSLSKSCLK